MDIAVNPDCGFVCIGPRFEIGGCHQPDCASFMAFPDTFQFEKVWIFLRILFEKTSEVVIAIVFIELGFRMFPPLDEQYI